MDNEGTIEFSRERSTVEILAPSQEIDLLEDSLSFDLRSRLCVDLRYEVAHWEQYLRDY